MPKFDRNCSASSRLGDCRRPKARSVTLTTGISPPRFSRENDNPKRNTIGTAFIAREDEQLAHRVTLKPSGHSFEVGEAQNVLQAGLEAGYALPYSCRAGVC